MKVVKSETPKEEVKFEDVFIPEEFEIICDDCLANEIDDLKENVAWLAEDVLGLTDVLDCIHSINKIMFDIITKQNEQIKDLEGEFQFHDTTILVLFIIFLLWNLVLTYNVFF